MVLILLHFLTYMLILKCWLLTATQTSQSVSKRFKINKIAHLLHIVMSPWTFISKSFWFPSSPLQHSLPQIFSEIEIFFFLSQSLC